MTIDEYWYWFCTIPGFGARKLQAILEYFGSPAEAFKASPEQIGSISPVRKGDIAAWRESIQKVDSACRQYHLLQQKNIQFITKADKSYPKRLLQMYDPPVGLFYRGSLPADEAPSAGIIGARACSPYGRETAYQLGKELAEQGIQVISGMALGIDGAGQQGAIDGGGHTFGVLGSGIDVCYPRENIELYCRIPKSGGLISEYCPGQPGLPRLFPIRNRIISALSDCIIVVEAREKSGTLITVDQALEQGKDVFAVPGRMGDPLSVGCNRLVQNGAAILTGIQDIYTYFHIEGASEYKQRKKKKKTLANDEKIIYSCLGLEPKQLEEILSETGLSVKQAMVALLQLELGRYISQPQKNYYSRRQNIQIGESSVSD